MTVGAVTEVWAGLFGVVARQWKQVAAGGLGPQPQRGFSLPALPLEALQLAYLCKGFGFSFLFKSISDSCIPLRSRFIVLWRTCTSFPKRKEGGRKGRARMD